MNCRINYLKKRQNKLINNLEKEDLYEALLYQVKSERNNQLKVIEYSEANRQELENLKSDFLRRQKISVRNSIIDKNITLHVYRNESAIRQKAIQRMNENEKEREKQFQMIAMKLKAQ